MNKQDLITRLRRLELDHEPEGYPAIKMKEITALLDTCEALGDENLQLRNGIKGDFSLDEWLEWDAGRSKIRNALAEITEIYAGMEGFEPVTALESYLLRIINQMIEAAGNE